MPSAVLSIPCYGINATLIEIGEDFTAELVRIVGYKLWQKKGLLQSLWRAREEIGNTFKCPSVYLKVICKFTQSTLVLRNW